MTPSRAGAWAAGAVALIGTAYAVVLAIGIARMGFSRPITDPILAIMEALTLLSAPALLISMLVLREHAPPEQRPFGTAALAFATIFTGLTSTVHFVELTAGRQAPFAGITWPSPAYAAELLAWDWFLGLALLCAAPLFAIDQRRERRIRQGLVASGTLCILGTVGPLIGDMRIQRIGIVGYAVVLPVTFFWIARLRDDMETVGSEHTTRGTQSHRAVSPNAPPNDR